MVADVAVAEEGRRDAPLHQEMLPHSGQEWSDGLGGFWGLQEGSQHCCLKTLSGGGVEGQRRCSVLAEWGWKSPPAAPPSSGWDSVFSKPVPGACPAVASLLSGRGAETQLRVELWLSPQAWHIQTAWLKTGWPESHRQSTRLEDTHSDQEAENSE